jgi:hypothetical protein
MKKLILIAALFFEFIGTILFIMGVVIMILIAVDAAHL